MTGEDIYNGLYENEELRGVIVTALNAESSIPCVCAGIQQDADNSGLGQILTNGGSIKLLTSNEPEKGLSVNDTFDFTDSSSNTYSLRIIGKARKSGMTILTVEAINI